MTASTHKEDHELVQACLAGDRTAADRLVRKALVQVRKVVYRILGPDRDYEDQVQETMYQVIKSMPRFRGDAAWTTWVTRITVNQARQELRRRKRRPSPAPLEAVADFSIKEPGPDTRAQEAELRRALYRLLDQIDEDKRIAVTLYEMVGMSTGEVAEATGVTRSTAKSRIWFGRKYLLEAASHDPVLSAWLERRSPNEE